MRSHATAHPWLAPATLAVRRSIHDVALLVQDLAALVQHQSETIVSWGKGGGLACLVAALVHTH